MTTIMNFEPKKVFEFFEIISKIPHGSGNTEKLADYCMDFAKKRNLEAVRDKAGNIVIYKGATKGYENSETVILQGHLDMVCEKAEDCSIDMNTQPISLCTDGEYIWADGTTLGADDGIAVAYILALLDSDDIAHPPIEALLTNDEEIGLLGVRELDKNLLHGSRLINIDSESEGVLTVSCAGGVRATCGLPLEFVKTKSDEASYKVEISGLLGGHSGVDINYNRQNAHILLGKLFEYLGDAFDFYVSSIDGGKKTNVIPHQASAIICVDKENAEIIEKGIKVFNKIAAEDLAAVEPAVKITLVPCELPTEHTDAESTRKLTFTLLNIPNGVQAMSPDIPNMVQTSLNMGELSIENHVMKMGYLIRSNAATGKQLIVNKLTSFIEFLNGTIEFISDYPVWEYKTNSVLRDIMEKAFVEVYSEEPTVCAIHAGLECGILAGKINDADMVSFGPDLENVHTPNERMSIASAARCWNYLLKVLEMCK
jgi:dipeptidase D